MSESTPNAPGIHLVLDGPDGVGISTQRDRLTAYLRERSIPCLETANPSEGQAGLLLRDMLLHNIPALAPSAMQRLYVSDRDDHYQQVVAPALVRGEVVVQARGEWSTVVYNAARGATEEERDNLARIAFGWHEDIEIPTLTIILVADLEITEARRAGRGGPVELFDGSDFQAKVIALYEDAYNCFQHDWSMRYEETSTRRPLVVIDASGTEQEIHAKVLQAIEAAGLLPTLESTS